MCHTSRAPKIEARLSTELRGLPGRLGGAAAGHCNLVTHSTNGTLRVAIDDLRDATVRRGRVRDAFGWDEEPRGRIEEQIADLDRILDELERVYDELFDTA